MLIKVLDVSFSYDSIEVLKNVTFEAKEGEILGIIGPNGSGKTTLIKCLFRALSPKKGVILIDGKNIELFSRIELARIISVVLQEDIIAPFTVLETILMGRYPHSNSLLNLSFDYEAKKVVLDVINKLKISRILERGLSEISGGERKRVHLARALVQQPKVLLLDEPTAHLDPKYQLYIMDVIREYTLRNKTITIASFHDLSLVAKYCDKVIILKDGKIVAIGDKEEVLTQKNLHEVYGVRMKIVKENGKIVGIIPDKIMEVDDI